MYSELNCKMYLLNEAKTSPSGKYLCKNSCTAHAVWGIYVYSDV